MTSEPCAHERDYTIGDAMKSYVAASALAGDAAIERDAALATIERIKAALDAPSGSLSVLDRLIRAALEPTDQPKGTKP